MRPTMRALLATTITLAVATAAAAAAPGTISDPAVVDATAIRWPDAAHPPEPSLAPALLVSDSAWLGIRSNGAIDGVRGFEHVLDLGSCRRRVVRSCTNYNGFVPVTLLTELDIHDTGFRTLIVATGYNDSDANFAEEVDAIVGRARDLGYLRVVWLTLRSNVSYTSPGSQGFAEVFRNNNATIAAIEAAASHPELVIADWAAYAHDQHGWFASDGIHLTDAGGYAASDYISRKMAHLDGRACPSPYVRGGPILDPCPDPDRAPPQVDLASLYPIGVWNDTYGFELEYEGSSSWPAPPWWEE